MIFVNNFINDLKHIHKIINSHVKVPEKINKYTLNPHKYYSFSI